jgi:hypothetical protein
LAVVLAIECAMRGHRSLAIVLIGNGTAVPENT